ncbi:MAG: hypothetical protein Q4A55_04120 [Aerococcus sp.]|nr:hypothetical protein [Aerococcus sp.]
MDQTINRLYQIESNANKELATVQDQKRQLKKQYDQKKTDYETSAQAKYQQEIAKMREKYDQERDQKIHATEDKYNENVEAIKRLVDEDQKQFIQRFFQGVKTLGVNADE